MALRQFVRCSMLIFILLCKGCHSQQPACGIAVNNNKIIGGQDASPGSWPWLATLFVNDTLCGGSLITDQWVLTAAHCISPSDIPGAVVFVGLNSLLDINPKQVIRTLQAVVCHPNYNSLTYENDICLLKLSAPVTFTNYVQPICLASENSTFFSGISSWITGFGLTSGSSLPIILQEANVPIMANADCQSYYQNVITNNMICAGLRAGGKTSCQGDLGGPLVSKKGSIWVQSGVASIGTTGCVNPMRPEVYTRVSQYLNWINGTITGTPPGFVTFTSTDPGSIFISLTPPTNASTTTTTTTTTTVPTTVLTTAPTTVPTTVHSGKKLIHFTHFTSLCVLVVLLHVLVGSG